MQKTIKILALGLAATTSVVAMNVMASPGVVISTNVPVITLNCVSNTGGVASPISITSAAPYSSWWGGLSSHFNGTNLQCQFKSQADGVIGNAQIKVFPSNRVPGQLAASITQVSSTAGYTLTAVGTNMVPHDGPAYLNYTVTMNKN